MASRAIKRYDLEQSNFGSIAPKKDGDYVLYRDHLAARSKARREGAEQERKRIREALGGLQRQSDAYRRIDEPGYQNLANAYEKCIGRIDAALAPPQEGGD